MAETYEGVVAVGGDLGTSTSKFCDGERVVCFSSVAGDALTDQLEQSWRRMNRSNDHRWVRNLALWDERRSCWRYVGAMTRSSQRPQWYTEGGVVQNFDDAYLGLQAGLFLLGVERGQPLGRVALGFGVPIKSGERTSELLFEDVRARLKTDGDRRFMPIRAKNLATGEERVEQVELAFSVVQFQAYGAYMVLLFSRFGMKLYNTYVVDVGHGTWIHLPIVENEADIALADSAPNGIHAITRNISRAIFERSGQKVKVQEQRIMEKLAAGQRDIEVPGAGVFNFQAMLDGECDALADEIMTRIRQDVGALGSRGVSLDYFALVGGGARLLSGRLARRITEYFGWDEAMAKERIVGEDALPVDPRYVNAAGFMLLARDQVAVERGEDVDPSFAIGSVVTDASAG
ncbi:MAG TPA: hypothetical protein VGQ83_37645 [Polyangia bacterium]|jgi:hypothetical protein